MFRRIIDQVVVATTQKYVNYRTSPTKANDYHRKMRSDTIIALCIPIGCIALLIEAYYRSNYKDAGIHVKKISKYGSKSISITNTNLNNDNKLNYNNLIHIYKNHQNELGVILIITIAITGTSA